MHKVAGLGYLFISMWPYGANQIAVFVHPANQQQVVYPIRETLCKPMKLQYLCIQPIRDQHPGFPNGIAVLSIPNRKPCVSSSCSTRGVSDTLGNGSIALCPSKMKPWIHTGSFPLLWQLSRVGIEGCFSVGLMLSQTRDLVQDFQHVVYSKEGTLCKVSISSKVSQQWYHPCCTTMCTTMCNTRSLTWDSIPYEEPCANPIYTYGCTLYYTLQQGCYPWLETFL